MANELLFDEESGEAHSTRSEQLPADSAFVGVACALISVAAIISIVWLTAS